MMSAGNDNRGVRYDLRFEGVKNLVERFHKSSKSESIKKWAEDF